MCEHSDLSQKEREFLDRADTDGRVFTTRRDRTTVEELKRKGLIEQNVYHGSYYWVRDKMRR